jgi:hypothetical protein
MISLAVSTLWLPNSDEILAMYQRRLPTLVGQETDILLVTFRANCHPEFFLQCCMRLTEEPAAETIQRSNQK